MDRETSSSAQQKTGNEYLTRIEIFPRSTTSLAPDTTQYPGASCGPRIISVTSTNLSSFEACAGAGGPPGYTAELTFTSAGKGCFFWFWGDVKWVLMSVEMRPDLRVRPGDPSHSGYLTATAPATVEKRRRRKSTFLKPCSPTCSWAPVTMERSSSDSTGAVHTWEKLFHCTFSKYLRSWGWAGGQRQSASWKIEGREERCWRWIARRLPRLPSRYNRIPVTGRLPAST
ncbi:pathogenesis-related thaumatin superfamily protein [Striga asiatica]|uniref:Pathogenesis-related thaumatin superfamily protein n=1 Tax=Striga asiatica TaxID=4170 RepID=A0A5A7QQC0_STRAF|nr:pathogenesis-related thaumatin superfamily protein [Striga asiatica]